MDLDNNDQNDVNSVENDALQEYIPFLPDGTPETRVTRVYQSIKNLRDLFELEKKKTMLFDEWIELAFLFARFEVSFQEEDQQWSLLEYMLRSNVIPTNPVDANGNNLLHAAVQQQNDFSIHTLVNEIGLPGGSYVKLFSSRNNDGKYPLQITIELENWDQVEVLLDYNFNKIYFFGDEELEITLIHCKPLIPTGDDDLHDLVLWIDKIIRSIQFQRILGFNVEKDMIIEEFEKLAWWPERHALVFDENELLALYQKLLTLVLDHNVELVRWLFTEMRASAIPPILYNYQGYSLADYACHSQKIIYHLDTKSRKDMLADSMFLYRYLSPFRDLAWKWDGKSTSFKTFTLYADTSRSLENHELTIIQENAVKELNTEMLELLLSRFGTDGGYVMPRLDLLVKYNDVEVLKWLHGKGLLELDSPFLDLAEEEESDDDEELTEFKEESDCAICYLKKRVPVELDCKHSFCRRCVQRLLASEEEYQVRFRCPLCRQLTQNSTSASLTVYSKLVSYLTEKAPWLNIANLDKKTTVAEILVAYAVDSNAVSVLEWLMNRDGIDGSKIRYANNYNLMHVAVDQDATLSVKWLLRNGYEDLARQCDSQGLTPIHLNMNKNNEFAKMIFNIFDKSLYPPDFTAVAETCANWEAQNKLTHIKGSKALGEFKVKCKDATLDELLPICTEVLSVTVNICNSEIKEMIFVHGRIDLIRWIFEEMRSDEPYSMFLFAEQLAESFEIPEFRAHLLKAGVSEEEINTVFNIWATDNLVESEFRDCYNKFHRALLDEAGNLELLKEAAKEQNVLKSKYKQTIKKIGYIEFYATNIFQHGLSAFLYAVDQGYTKVVEWMLNEPDLPISKTVGQGMDQKERLKHLVPTLRIRYAIPKRADMLRLLFDAIERAGLSVADIYEYHDPDPAHADNIMRNENCFLLDKLIWEYAYTSKYKSDELFEAIEFVLDHPHFDINRPGSNILSRAIYIPFTADEDHTDLVSHGPKIVKFIRFLVDKGAALPPLITDIVRCLDFECFRHLVPLIRYLALELDYDIEYIEYRHAWKTNANILTEAEFKELQLEQRQHRKKLREEQVDVEI
jgi:ankyrin repeat protein